MAERADCRQESDHLPEVQECLRERCELERRLWWAPMQAVCGAHLQYCDDSIIVVIGVGNALLASTMPCAIEKVPKMCRTVVGCYITFLLLRTGLYCIYIVY